MKLAVVALTVVALLGALLPSPVLADARYAVVHITNNTYSDMSFYRRWVWNYGKPNERVQIDWRMTKIPPGATYTVHFAYDGAHSRSPDLIVVFDSDRNNGTHWEMVKLLRGASEDYRDRNSGFTYALEFDNDRREYASLRARNGGSVTILDRRASRPMNAEEFSFRR